MDATEALSRAYEPAAWATVDLYRQAAVLPRNPNSLWPDFRPIMTRIAEKRASELLERMAAARLGGWYDPSLER